MSRRRPNAQLGHAQVLVLRLLAARAMSVAELSRNWPTLSEDSARASVMRLANRGLVDAVGFTERGAREFGLTEEGARVERAQNVYGDEGEG